MKKKNAGFTLIEILITIAIIGIASAFAIPTFINVLPNWRAKAAASDLFSNLQTAKLTAIRKGMNCGIIFTGDPDAGVPCQYQVTLLETDLTTIRQVIRTVTLADYGSQIAFRGPVAGSIFPRFNSDTVARPAIWRLTFNSRGMLNANALNVNTVNFSSMKYTDTDTGRTYYRAGATNAGVIQMQRYEGSAWQ